MGPHSPLFFSLLTSGSARPELLGTRQGRMLRTLPQPPGPPHTLPPPGHWGKARLHPCPVVRGLEANHLAWPPAPESGCRMGTVLWVQQVPGPRAPPRGTRTTSAPTCQARGHKLSKRGAHGPRPSGPQGCEGAGSRDGRPNGRRGAQAPGTGCWQGFWSNLSKIVALGGGGAGGWGWGWVGEETRDRAPSPSPKLRSSAAKCRADLAAAPAGGEPCTLLLLELLSPSLPGSGRGRHTASDAPPEPPAVRRVLCWGAAAVPAQEEAGPSEPTWGPT